MISINDLLKIDDKKKQIKKEIYTKIVEQFSSKIKKSSEMGHKQVFLTIPLFLIGYPVLIDQQRVGMYQDSSRMVGILWR